jgi:hypothetical protein
MSDLAAPPEESMAPPVTPDIRRESHPAALGSIQLARQLLPVREGASHGDRGTTVLVGGTRHPASLGAGQAPSSTAQAARPGEGRADPARAWAPRLRPVTPRRDASASSLPGWRLRGKAIWSMRNDKSTRKGTARYE